MVVDRIIAHAGKLLVHLIRALLVCWQRMLRLGLSVGTLGGIIALVFGAYVTHTAPPAPLTWVAALFFGLALGYAAAMTVLADEMLLGIFEAIRVLEGDAKAGMRAAAVAAEREAGEAGRGIMRFLGHPRAAGAASPGGSNGRPPGAPIASRQTVSSKPLVTLSAVAHLEPGQTQTDETLAAIAATEKFITTAPHVAVNARPVRADQLPRIGWASDEAEAQRKRDANTPGARLAMAGETVLAASALAEMPPLPIRTLRNQPRAEAAAPAPTPSAPGETEERSAPGARSEEQESPAHDEDAATQPVALDEAPTPDAEPVIAPVEDAAEAPAHALDATDEVDAERTVRAAGVDVDEDSVDTAPGRAVAAPAITRPLPAVTRPIEAEREERGIWARISQALIGNTTVPLRDVDTAGNAGGGPETGPV